MGLMEVDNAVALALTVVCYLGGIILTIYMKFSRAVILRRIRKSGRVITMTPLLISMLRDSPMPLQSPSGMPPPPAYELPKPTAPSDPPPAYYQ